MFEKTIAELAAGLRAGEYSSVELTRAYLDRIQALDSGLNSYITPLRPHPNEATLAQLMRLTAVDKFPGREKS